MHKFFAVAMFAAVFSFTGCDTDPHKAAEPPPAVDGIDHGPDAPRAHLLEQEDKTDATGDGMDIEVDEEGVSVDGKGE